jgi:phosphoribosylformylglycinamidine cyclo-ligase
MPDFSDRYAEAGVHLDVLDALKTNIVGLTRKTRRPEVLSREGAFGGLFAVGSLGIPDPVLVSSMDGVGTKIKIACLSGNHSGIGADIANHSINDILTCGAQPLFFMDYLASGRVDPRVIAEVIGSLADACVESGMALLGGETAEMPDMYAEGEYDLAGCIVGVVSRNNIIDGQSIRPGDRILGLTSNGLHTNGYSLVRRIFLSELQWSLDRYVEEFQSTLAEELLRPHRSYLAEITRLLRNNLVQGLAHITGGGFYGNLPRILPDGCGARIDARAWEPLPIFRTVQNLGHVRPEEMYRVFNMGMGFLVVVHPGDSESAIEEIPELLPIGEVIAGKEVVIEGM